jgi:hypothetical protein
MRPEPAFGNAADFELDVMGNRVQERYFDPQDGFADRALHWSEDNARPNR